MMLIVRWFVGAYKIYWFIIYIGYIIYIGFSKKENIFKKRLNRYVS